MAYTRVIISRSYGKWSSGTVVELRGKRGDMAVVHHVPSKETFTVPPDILVIKRNR